MKYGLLSGPRTKTETNEKKNISSLQKSNFSVNTAFYAIIYVKFYHISDLLFDVVFTDTLPFPVIALQYNNQPVLRFYQKINYIRCTRAVLDCARALGPEAIQHFSTIICFIMRKQICKGRKV